MRRVLFVCIGNSCRSQMAEGFARHYGKDVLETGSAGLSPASMVSPVTRAVMEERNIRLDGHFPKAIEDVPGGVFDLIVNMSGYPLPPRAPCMTGPGGAKGASSGVEVLEWDVADPIGCPEDYHRDVRDHVERLVMQLILTLRRASAMGAS